MSDNARLRPKGGRKNRTFPSWRCGSLSGARRIEAVDSCIDGVDSCIDGVDSCIDGGDSRIDEVDSCIEEVDSRIEEVDSRIEEVDWRVDEVDSCIDGLVGSSKSCLPDGQCTTQGMYL